MTNTAELPDLDRLVRVYIKIRTTKAAVQKETDEKLAALEEQMSQVSMAIKDHMLSLGEGVKSVKTNFGTAILSEKRRYNATDWDAFKQFILAHGAVELLERRIAQKNMDSFLEENPGVVPPGLNSMTSYEVVVRKPTT